MVRCGSKNLHQKEMYLKEIRWHAQNMLTILASKVYMIEWALNDHLMNTTIFALITNKIIFIQTPEIMKTNSYMHKSSRPNNEFRILEEVGGVEESIRNNTSPLPW